MKPSLPLAFFALSASASPTFLNSIPPSSAKISTTESRQANQVPFMPLPNMPSSDSKDNDQEPAPAGNLFISDVLGKERIINIFAGFTRDVDAISARLDDTKKNSTILAPLNSAIQKLPRKPWEDPKDYDKLGANAYGGQGGEERAQNNLRKFVEAHIVPASPWSEGEKVDTLGGNKVWWEMKDGTKMIQPGNIEVSSVASRVANGEIWVIKGVLNYT